MIGIDANILLRYFLEDDPVWSPAVETFIESKLSVDEPGYVNPITLVEVVWSLRRHARYDREALCEVIEGLLAFEKMVIGESEAVTRALNAYRAGGAGFVDYFIAELNTDAGAATTMTIDKKAAAREPFQLLR
ncbi:type II toxin-antitoxin system VapC family toxin [Chelatococcus sambhunathii]|uniref:Type II toxin-antitoxin system VapC family toxin n=1 Tax=Chelatococcus sambhunathii TaxID=363953 RepID=A0ABU1DIS6_9HYPH|nr:type II toxin-antitoxin system VapC family toxin [Chelatococcus sambhunathii]MDR4307915.1 type II toxin-antitoxin system VapC family toxin [Chelatococcus sambhunathii]